MLAARIIGMLVVTMHIVVAIRYQIMNILVLITTEQLLDIDTACATVEAYCFCVL